MSKIKNKNHLIKLFSDCFTPTHVKFNFSFISYNNLNPEDIISLYNRIIFLSSEPYITVAGYNKSIGFEHEKINISKKINDRFYQRHKTFDGKYTIFRLYPNNNPRPGRIIGKFIRNVFYIFFMDSKGELYKH